MSSQLIRVLECRSEESRFEPLWLSTGSVNMSKTGQFLVNPMVLASFGRYATTTFYFSWTKTVQYLAQG